MESKIQKERRNHTKNTKKHQILTKNGDSNIKRIPEPKSQLQKASKSQSNVLQTIKVNT